MKVHSVVALVGLAIGFALPTFAQLKGAVDPKIEQQIRALVAKFDEAFNRNDPTALAALYAEDGARVFNGTSHGRQAIEKWYAQSFQSLHPNNHYTNINRLIAVGNEVRATGKWSDNPQDENLIRRSSEGYCSWIFVREGDAWKIRRSSFSESHNWSVNL